MNHQDNTPRPKKVSKHKKLIASMKTNGFTANKTTSDKGEAQIIIQTASNKNYTYSLDMMPGIINAMRSDKTLNQESVEALNSFFTLPTTSTLKVSSDKITVLGQSESTDNTQVVTVVEGRVVYTGQDDPLDSQNAKLKNMVDDLTTVDDEKEETVFQVDGLTSGHVIPSDSMLSTEENKEVPDVLEGRVFLSPQRDKSPSLLMDEKPRIPVTTTDKEVKEVVSLKTPDVPESNKTSSNGPKPINIDSLHKNFSTHSRAQLKYHMLLPATAALNLIFGALNIFTPAIMLNVMLGVAVLGFMATQLVIMQTTQFSQKELDRLQQNKHTFKTPWVSQNIILLTLLTLASLVFMNQPMLLLALISSILSVMPAMSSYQLHHQNKETISGLFAQSSSNSSDQTLKVTLN